MDTKFCIALGVSADWGIICNWFLRLFDVANRDIALSRSQIDCMVETLDAVFIEGRVFQKIMQGASGAAVAAAASGAAAEPLPSVGAQGEAPGFITTKVMSNLRRKRILLLGGQTVLLWGELRDAHKAELLERVQNAAMLTKERPARRGGGATAQKDLGASSARRRPSPPCILVAEVYEGGGVAAVAQGQGCRAVADLG